MGAGLSGEELLAWHMRTVDGWKRLIERSPAVLDVPCDVYGVSNLSGLLRHITAVYLRYAQRLMGQPESPYEAIGMDPSAIFASQDLAHGMMEVLLNQPEFDWDATQDYTTISWGRVRSKRRTIFAHAVLHGVRHFAQMAMLARQAGFKPDWSMDYLAMDAIRLDPRPGAPGSRS